MFAYRLDSAKAQKRIGRVQFHDYRFGIRYTDLAELGDMVIARKDGLISYHLAVVFDDVAAGVELITRGEDLLEITPLHVILQRLLGFVTPQPTCIIISCAMLPGYGLRSVLMPSPSAPIVSARAGFVPISFGLYSRASKAIFQRVFLLLLTARFRGRKLLRAHELSFNCVGIDFGLRPKRIPFSLARSIPSLRRSLIRLRSNSAIAPRR